jgi:hypothetical protein
MTAQALDDLASLGDEGGVRRRRRVGAVGVHEAVAGAERADQDRVVAMLASKPDIVREGRSDPQVEPARGGLAAQEV